MFIQTEETPNPATLKFIPGTSVMGSSTIDFPNQQAAQSSPLAARLFDIEGVNRVFFGGDFITVTATEDDWHILKPPILGAIMEHFTADLPLLTESAGAPETVSEEASEDDEIVVQIKELLDTRVRPAVAQDGGDIIFHRYENGVVYLQMQGSCSGCPSSSATLKHGIENMLKHYIPEVVSVEPV
ncbi:MAG: NifU family protein [Proteobacteria bacterium]|nr:NifU family protein [Pseudomonadota bacterium]